MYACRYQSIDLSIYVSISLSIYLWIYLYICVSMSYFDFIFDDTMSIVKYVFLLTSVMLILYRYERPFGFRLYSILSLWHKSNQFESLAYLSVLLSIYIYPVHVGMSVLRNNILSRIFVDCIPSLSSLYIYVYSLKKPPMSGHNDETQTDTSTYIYIYHQHI